MKFCQLCKNLIIPIMVFSLICCQKDKISFTEKKDFYEIGKKNGEILTYIFVYWKWFHDPEKINPNLEIVSRLSENRKYTGLYSLETNAHQQLEECVSYYSKLTVNESERTNDSEKPLNNYLYYLSSAVKKKGDMQLWYYGCGYTFNMALGILSAWDVMTPQIWLKGFERAYKNAPDEIPAHIKKEMSDLVPFEGKLIMEGQVKPMAEKIKIITDYFDNMGKNLKGN